MKVDIYSSSKSSTTFLFVPAKADLAKIALPAKPDYDLSVWKYWRSITVEPGSHLVAVDPDKLLEQIAQGGFYISRAGSQVTEHSDRM